MFNEPSLLFSLLAFVAVLAPLVALHELGHYLVGRWCGIGADVFSIGFGREILGWTDKRGTRWKIGWLPLGGYVQFRGDADGVSTPQPVAPGVHNDGTFGAATLWRRALTVAAGPAANFLVALIILTAFAFAYGRPDTPAVVAQIMPNSAAAAAGLQPGDRLISVDGRAMTNFADIPMSVMHRPGDALPVVIERGGARRTVTLTPRLVRDTDGFGNVVERAVIGIMPGPQVLTPISIVAAPGVAVHQAWGIVTQMADVIGQLFVGDRSIRDLGGLPRIAKASGEQASLGPVAFAFFAALISINLGFVNLLPVPMLDGGHLLFFAVEAVRRRPVSVTVQQWAFRAGFAALAVLMIVVTFNDLSSFGVWQRLAGLIG